MTKTFICKLSIALLLVLQSAVADRDMEALFAQLDGAGDAQQSNGSSVGDETPSQDADMTQRLMDKSIKLYNEGSFKDALYLVDSVLALDGYHAQAMRYKNKILSKLESGSQKTRQTVRTEAIAQIKEAWNVDVALPGEAQPKARDLAIPDTGSDKLIERLNSIEIPVLDVMDSTVQEVVSLLAKHGRAAGDNHPDIDMILVGMEEADKESSITLSVDNITMYEALLYFVEMASLKFEIREGMVVLMPANYFPAQSLELRSYNVPPEVGQDLLSAGGNTSGGLFDSSPSTTSESSDVSSFFSMVDFSGDASAVYKENFQKLFVKNTRSNLEVVEAIVSDLTAKAIHNRSQQVEIEAKFVDVSSGALEELGFDWTIYGDDSVAGFNYKDGDYFQAGSGYRTDSGALLGDTVYVDPVSGQQLITPTSEGGGQNLFGGAYRDNQSVYEDTLIRSAETLGGVPAAMMFTDDDNVDLRLTALDQSGMLDILASPRVVTKSGVEATLRIAETHRYPQDYVAESGQRSPPIVKPQDWDDFDLGISLKVTPVVDTENRTVELDLIPEILAFRGFDSYKVGVDVYDGGGNNSIEIIGTEEPLFALMPAMERRTAQAQVVVADGHTVVMGGLVYEQKESFRDQVPILGDIPYLGRFFRSEGSRTAKKNLKIFVKPTLIDPQGLTVEDKKLAVTN